MIAPTAAILLVVLAVSRGAEDLSDECSETVGAVLVNGVCTCNDTDHVISSDRSACLPILFGGYGDACVDTAQCLVRMASGAACVGGSCTCVEGFHYLHGRCWRSRGLGDACSSNESCYALCEADTLTCSAGHCECGLFTYSPLPGMCRRKAQAGDPCDLAMDCSEGVCDTTTYTCEKTGSAVEQDTLRDETGDVDLPCGNCTGPHKQCTDGGQCVCEMGYFASPNDTCVPELGEACTQDSECSHISKAVCRRSGSTGGRICGCQGNWAPDSSNRKCIKSRKYGFNCQADEQCAYYGGFCYLPREMCECPNGEHYTGELCWPYVGLGEKCSVPADCYVPSGQVNCTAGVCECLPGFRHAASNDCWKVAEVLGDPCEDATECSFAGDTSAVTCKRNKCACAAGHMKINKTTCVVAPGGPCDSDDDCASLHSYQCLNRTCQCPNGTVASVYAVDCLPVATAYGDNCTEQGQCAPLLGDKSECSDKTCQCSRGFHHHRQFCWADRGLLDTCTSDQQCYSDKYADLSECRNSLCRCKFGLRENWADGRCESSGTTLGYSLISVAVGLLLVRFW